MNVIQLYEWKEQVEKEGEEGKEPNTGQGKPGCRIFTGKDWTEK